MTDHADSGELKTIGQVIARAREVLDPDVYTWAAAGAGEEVTVSRNSQALNRLALVPRIARDVSVVDATTSFLGIGLDLPVMLAPIGPLALFDEDDAVAAASAAAAQSTIAFCSSLTTSVWEEVAATAPHRHMFQLYVHGDRRWVLDVVQTVEQAGFAGLCITLDAAVIGRRDRSLEAGFTWTPAGGRPGLAGRGSDPSFRRRFTFDDLEWLCGQTELPVIIKGVVAVEDAVRAVDCGVGGVYVSNHGGRMVDHSVSTIEVLAEIAEAVPDGVDIAIDGGFVRGVEVCKALALGARAVAIGRLQCWALAVGGVPALIRVLEILRQEIEVTMANIGATSPSDITPGHVRWTMPAAPLQ